MPTLTYLGLGSNVGNRHANLDAAITRLSQCGTILARSSFYETEPVDFAHQPWFLNCVLALETHKMPRQLLSAIVQVEHDLGRRRLASPPKGPRTIDIDILLFGNFIIDTPDLTVPHPALHQRRFVLEPLAEIAPDLRHPILKKTVRELLDALPPGQAVRLWSGGELPRRG